VEIDGQEVLERHRSNKTYSYAVFHEDRYVFDDEVYDESFKFLSKGFLELEEHSCCCIGSYEVILVGHNRYQIGCYYRTHTSYKMRKIMRLTTAGEGRAYDI
jgi:hypothetical protein